jgi:segregation and condensation protein B
MERTQVKHVIEAALLAAGRPLSLEKIASLFTAKASELDKETLQGALAELALDYEHRGLELKEISSGYRIQIRRSMTDWLTPLWEERAPRYTRALLETLALIAYRQPITRGEIEDVRGVAVSTNITRTLLERNWIRVVGHRDVPGRPAMFGTTRDFLDYFGLKKLEELPTLAEIKDGMPEESPQSDLIEALSSLRAQGMSLDAGLSQGLDAGHADEEGGEAGLVIAHAAAPAEETEADTAFGEDSFTASGEGTQVVEAEVEWASREEIRARASYSPNENEELDDDAVDGDELDEDVEDGGELADKRDEYGDIDDELEDIAEDEDFEDIPESGDFDDDDSGGGDANPVDEDELGEETVGEETEGEQYRGGDRPGVRTEEFSMGSEREGPADAVAAALPEEKESYADTKDDAGMEESSSSHRYGEELDSKGAAPGLSVGSDSAPDDALGRDSSDDDTVVELVRSESH